MIETHRGESNFLSYGFKRGRSVFLTPFQSLVLRVTFLYSNSE